MASEIREERVLARREAASAAVMCVLGLAGAPSAMRWPAAIAVGLLFSRYRAGTLHLILLLGIRTSVGLG